MRFGISPSSSLVKQTYPKPFGTSSCLGFPLIRRTQAVGWISARQAGSRIWATYENTKGYPSYFSCCLPRLPPFLLRLALSAILRLKQSSLVFLAPVCSTMGTLVANHTGRSFVLPIGNTTRRDVAEANLMAIRPEIGRLEITSVSPVESFSLSCPP